MDAARVINMLKAKEYDSLLSLADCELIGRVLKNHVHITTSKRMKEAIKYLDGPGQHIYVCNYSDYQLLTNGRSAFFLNRHGKLDVEITCGPKKDLSTYLRTPPGDEVEVIWMSLHLEIELHKGSDKRKQDLYVKVGRVYVNAELLSQARAILGGDDLRVYQQGESDMLQMESENGKAIIQPMPPDKLDTTSLVDVTGELSA